jgi:CheY-like chemotaxis protein
MSIPLKILVLDDDDIRHEAFALEFEKHIVTHVRTYDEAVTALDGERFDLIQLDHDLNDFPLLRQSKAESIVGKFEMTGYDVAKVIAALPDEKKPGRVVIHSWNPPGARAMHEVLFRANIRVSIQPFGMG